jgi:hypothetical protein
MLSETVHPKCLWLWRHQLQRANFNVGTGSPWLLSLLLSTSGGVYFDKRERERTSLKRLVKFLSWHLIVMNQRRLYVLCICVCVCFRPKVSQLGQALLLNGWYG